MRIPISFNKNYLCRKSFFMATAISIGISLAKLDLDNLSDVNYLLKHLFSMIFTIISLAGFFYLIYSRYYLKRVQALSFFPEEGETILEERVVSYGKNWRETYFGKLYKTSKRVVFIAPKRTFTKELYFEFPLEMIDKEEKKQNFWWKSYQIISKENKKYTFEVYS